MENRQIKWMGVKGIFTVVVMVVTVLVYGLGYGAWPDWRFYFAFVGFPAVLLLIAALINYLSWREDERTIEDIKKNGIKRRRSKVPRVAGLTKR